MRFKFKSYYSQILLRRSAKPTFATKGEPFTETTKAPQTGYPNLSAPNLFSKFEILLKTQNSF